MPAHIELAGAKLEKAQAVDKAKVKLDKAEQALNQAILEALEYGVSKAELARRLEVSETAIYKKAKKLQGK
ncbi:MAG: HTH domain-containing protein [Micrococcaceae bacterium]